MGRDYAMNYTHDVCQFKIFFCIQNILQFCVKPLSELHNFT